VRDRDPPICEIFPKNQKASATPRDHPATLSPIETGVPIAIRRIYRELGLQLRNNAERPRGAIGNRPPIMLLNHDGPASPPLPAIAREPENSSFPRSKNVSVHLTWDSAHRWTKKEAQVSR
jgi:hypothetical protein